MAEALSPQLKQRGPFSPSSPFFLGSNDDQFERAQARAARAAAIRRKSVALGGPPLLSTDDSCLDKNQILELFQNCIKLASENKINQKNTWELNLIDHLCDVIKVEQENDAETNFQKASCTLEAGVKIYSMRVDSVHSEAYKVLGGINRVGQEQEEQDIASEDATDVNKQEERCLKKDDKKLSPLSTLESSFEALNVKKFDAAFAVDPLYHQTSAQFDEGGAKGLLLNNLGVYGNCQVLFDSLEVPGKCTSSNEKNTPETIDLSFAQECIEQMVLQMPKLDEISPSLRQIVSQFDDNSRRSYEAYTSGENSYTPVDETCEDNFEVGGNADLNNGTWDLDHDDQASVVDDGNDDGGPMIPDQQEECDSFTFNQFESDDKFEQVDDYLLLSLGFPSKRNAWAGPEHWKYRKSKDSENPDKENEPALKEKRPKTRKAEMDIDFTKAFEMDTSAIFSSPKNPKSILLPASKAPCNTKLPEDCHYKPESLVKLFLLPNVMCLGRRQRIVSDEFSQNQDQEGPIPSWDDDNGFGGSFDDDNGVEDGYSNIEDSTTLVSQPRQVNKIEVQYDKTSKQVDVQVLKETLWDSIQKITASPLQKGADEKISFKEMLANFPSDCRAAACIEDISPHLCFICLLHLANEHGLRIIGHANMDDLSVYL